MEIWWAGEEVAEEYSSEGPQGRILGGLILLGTGLLAVAEAAIGDHLPRTSGAWYCGPSNGPACDEAMLNQQVHDIRKEEAETKAEAQARAQQRDGSDTLIFYRGTYYYDAVEITQNRRFDVGQIAAVQAGVSHLPGLYLSTQFSTAAYYADLAGFQGRGGGPAVMQIIVQRSAFLAFAKQHGIIFETPVERPPTPGQTETRIPPTAIGGFNATIIQMSWDNL